MSQVKRHDVASFQGGGSAPEKDKAQNTPKYGTFTRNGVKEIVDDNWLNQQTK